MSNRPTEPVIGSATAHRDAHGALLVLSINGVLHTCRIEEDAAATLHHALGIVRAERPRQSSATVLAFPGRKSTSAREALS